MDAIETTVALPIEETEALVRDALAANGFGVLTEIDIAATFKAKLDLDHPPLKILGACNPGYANRALEADPSAALLLPCNVVLEAVDGGTSVKVADPRSMMPDPAFAELANEAAAKLTAAVESLPA